MMSITRLFSCTTLSFRVIFSIFKVKNLLLVGIREILVISTSRANASVPALSKSEYRI
jgi:hypothetical protein